MTLVNNIEKILAFHEKYNLIFDEQAKLPFKEGERDYSIIEDNIFSKSQNLIRELTKFKNNPENDVSKILDEINNIIDGCNRLIINPYDQFDGRTNLV